VRTSLEGISPSRVGVVLEGGGKQERYFSRECVRRSLVGKSRTSKVGNRSVFRGPLCEFVLYNRIRLADYEGKTRTGRFGKGRRY